MKIVINCLAFLAVTCAFSVPALAQEDPVVLADGDVAITKSELEYLVGKWTRQMRDSALQDEGDRLELLNLMLANKKVARDADRLVAEHPELTLDFQNGIDAFKRDFALAYYRTMIEYPDFSELAAEQYKLEKDKYARIPERRMSSHILFASPPGQSREGVLAEAAEVLAQLREGADFQEMVERHSDEPGAALKQGKFSRWIAMGDTGVSPPYIEGVFSIESVGEYSDLVQTQFGVHIIRLDEIQPESYQSFEQVKDKIVAELSLEYAQLALKNHLSQFNMSGEAVIKDDLIDDVLAPYATAE